MDEEHCRDCGETVIDCRCGGGCGGMLRWLNRRDMSQILEIEAGTFFRPWTEEEFLHLLRNRNCIGMIVELDRRVVGYMVYEFHKERLHLLNFAVDPECRRRGFGRQMIQRLKDQLSMQRRREIRLSVPETFLKMQLFLRSQGFIGSTGDGGNIDFSFTICNPVEAAK